MLHIDDLRPDALAITAYWIEPNGADAPRIPPGVAVRVVGMDADTGLFFVAHGGNCFAARPEELRQPREYVDVE